MDAVVRQHLASECLDASCFGVSGRAATQGLFDPWFGAQFIPVAFSYNEGRYYDVGRDDMERTLSGLVVMP